MAGVKHMPWIVLGALVTFALACVSLSKLRPVPDLDLEMLSRRLWATPPVGWPLEWMMFLGTLIGAVLVRLAYRLGGLTD